MVSLLSISKHHIDVVIEEIDRDKRWRFTGSYSHPDHLKWYMTWNLLKSLKAASDLPWLVVGTLMRCFFLGKRMEGSQIDYLTTSLV